MAFSINAKKSSKEEANKAAVEEDKSKNKFSLDLNSGVSLLQVVPDDADGSFRPVIGGYKYDQIDGRVIVKFKAVGQYTFIVMNTDQTNYSPPIRVSVELEQPWQLLITDEGFMPKIIRIDEGTTLKWSWSKLASPHSVYEAEYCDAHCGLYRLPKKYLKKN